MKLNNYLISNYATKYVGKIASFVDYCHKIKIFKVIMSATQLKFYT